MKRIPPPRNERFDLANQREDQCHLKNLIFTFRHLPFSLKDVKRIGEYQ